MIMVVPTQVFPTVDQNPIFLSPHQHLSFYYFGFCHEFVEQFGKSDILMTYTECMCLSPQMKSVFIFIFQFLSPVVYIA